MSANSPPVKQTPRIPISPQSELTYSLARIYDDTGSLQTNQTQATRQQDELDVPRPIETY